MSVDVGVRGQAQEVGSTGQVEVVPAAREEESTTVDDATGVPLYRPTGSYSGPGGRKGSDRNLSPHRINRKGVRGRLRRELWFLFRRSRL